MLAGFRSRWMTPFSCAYSSASAICLAIAQRLLQRHRALRDALRQRRPFHQFHHQRALFHAVDRRDVGMIQRRQHLRLAREARHAVGILREGLGQHLDRDVAVELGVGGALDLAHAALAELGSDAVMRDGGLWAHRA